MLVRDNLLQEKDREQQDPECVPLISTYNRLTEPYSSCLQKVEHPLNQ